MTAEQVRQAAEAIVARSTTTSGVPYHLEDEATLDQLAVAVAATMLAPGGGADAA